MNLVGHRFYDYTRWSGVCQGYTYGQDLPSTNPTMPETSFYANLSVRVESLEYPCRSRHGLSPILLLSNSR
ncbi:MAG: hypothetical protein RLZZ597_689 [Cyanobacteriota bacterium]|jgi:hypothetical protein